MPSDPRHERGAWKPGSITVTLGRAVLIGEDAAPPAHCVGSVAAPVAYALKSGVGTAAPMQTSCDSVFDSPVALWALENTCVGASARNSPAPPRIVVRGPTLKPPNPPPKPPPNPPAPPRPPPAPPPPCRPPWF